MSEVSKVKVSGSGKTYDNPDKASFSVTITEVRPTSKEASVAANDKVEKVLEILHAGGIKKEEVKKNRIQVGHRYDYKDGIQTVAGQEATITIDVKQCRHELNGSALGQVMDNVVVVDGLQVSGVNFDLEDKTESKKKARALAFEDAKAKASQYAQLSGLKLGKVVSVEEHTSNYVMPMAFAYSPPVERSVGVHTQVEVGQVEISVDSTITFTLE